MIFFQILITFILIIVAGGYLIMSLGICAFGADTTHKWGLWFTIPIGILLFLCWTSLLFGFMTDKPGIVIMAFKEIWGL